jgi:hypothetical protein
MKAPKITTADLQTGDTLLYEKSIAIGRIEQIFTRSKFNHSSLVEVVDGEIWCYEAIWPRVVRRSFTDSNQHTKLIMVKRPRFGFDAQKYVELSKSLVGKKYDLNGLLCQIPCQLWGGWLGNKSMKKVYCSKANAWVWNQLHGLYTDWYRVAPSELFEDLLDFDTFQLQLP